jgi:hypothetical protein
MNSTEENEKAISRLRASKQEALKQLHREGEEAGIHFALHTAEYLDLERLHRWRGETDGSVSPETTFKEVALVLADGDDSEEDTMDWAREQYGHDIEHAEWVEGFISGALAKYNELRKNL